MFENGLKESTQTEIELKDIKYEAFLAVLEWM
jgi:hypothetical protein